MAIQTAEEFRNALEKGYLQSGNTKIIDVDIEISNEIIKTITAPNFQKNVFNKDLRISFSEKVIVFQSCTFHGEVQVIDCRGVDIKFIGCTFNKGIIIENSAINELQLQSIKSEEEVKIQECNIQSLLFRHDFALNKGLFFLENKVEKLNFDNINDLNFEIDKKSKNRVIKRVYFYGDFQKSNIVLRDLELHNLQYQNFNDSSFPNRIKLENIKMLEGSELIISGAAEGNKSIFKNTEWENVNLRNVLKLEINDHSDLTDLIEKNVKWKITAKTKNNEVKDNEFNRLRSMYRRMKNLAENQRDHIRAQYFYSLEMDVQTKIFKYQIFNKFNLKYLQEAIIFFFSWLFTNHGRNWFRGIGWLFILNALFFYSIFKLLHYDFIIKDNLYWSWNLIENIDQDLIKGFFKLLNPLTFSVKDFNGEDLVIEKEGFIAAIIFFWKIFYFMIIYQTVIAFRKYTRKF